MTDEELDNWNDDQRANVISYLQRQGIQSPNVGEWPAFEMAPHLGIWCIESEKQPGKIGWWAFAGDCPTDYVSENGNCHPRSALSDLVSKWKGYIPHMKDGRDPPNVQFGTKSEEIRELGDLLESRVSVLEDWLANDELWEDR